MKRLFPAALLWGLAAACGAARPEESPAPTPAGAVEVPSAGDRTDLDVGIVQVQCGAWDSGIEHLTEFAARPGIPTELRVEALSWIGHAHTLLGDPEGALAAIRLALEAAPEDPWLHYAAGTALLTLGRITDAIEAYGIAIALDPGHIKALQWRGHAYSQLSRDKEAEADFAAAIVLLEAADPEQIASWAGNRRAMLRWTRLERARALDALGRRAEAAEAREAAHAAED